MVTGSALAKPSLQKRLKRWFEAYKWPLIGFMWLMTIALGYVGFYRHFSAIGETRPPADIFYVTLQLFTLQSGSVPGPIGWELQVARFVAPAMVIYTSIQALAIILRDQFQLIRLRFLRDHVVICGLGRKGLLLCKGFRERGERVVVIEQDGGNSLLGQCSEQGTIILIGNAADPGLLRRARIGKAKHIISVCGDDGANAEIAVQTRELVWARQGKALLCLAHIIDFQLCKLLSEREIAASKLDAFRLGFFNIFQSGARVLLDKYPPFSSTGEYIGPSPHIVVVGLGRMGESLVVNAARKWRDRDDANGERLRITLIDREAERKKEALCLRYPQLEGVCELISAQMDIQAPEFERADFLFDDQGCSDVTMIYVCLDGDSSALATALKLRQRVRTLEIPIVVRMIHDAGLATVLRGEKDKRDDFVRMHAFGLLDHTCTPDLTFGCTYEILARAAHEEYVRSEKKKGSTPETNPSMVPWEELPEGLKESNRNQAEHIRVKLEAIGCDIAMTNDWNPQLFEFSPEEVELLSEMEHERFVKERLRAGWRYVHTKDIEKKINPTLIPYKDLSEEEREKDRIFVRGLPAFLAKVGFQVYRLRKQE